MQSALKVLLKALNWFSEHLPDLFLRFSNKFAPQKCKWLDKMNASLYFEVSCEHL